MKTKNTYLLIALLVITLAGSGLYLYAEKVIDEIPDVALKTISNL